MYIYFLFCLCLISWFDIKSMRIPDPLVLLTALAVFRCGYHSAWILPLLAWLLCAVIASALNTDLPYGMGDAKLLSAIALCFGTEGLCFVFIAASVLSGTVCSVLLLLKKINKKSRIPFGPFLCFSLMLFLTLRQLPPCT